MRLIYISITLLLMIGCSREEGQHPVYQFEYTTPETVGWSSVKLDSLGQFLESAGSSALMLMVDGKVIFEWGEVDKPHTIHSIRKAMINSLYGIKVSEGVIDTSMTLGELNIDDIPPGLSDLEKSARIADVLKSRSGVYHNAAAVSEGMLRGMPERDSHAPGTYYYYNNWDFNVAGHILELHTGKSIYDLFLEEIAIPLGMYDYMGRYETIDGEAEVFEIPETDGFYQIEKSKSKFPAYHFRLSARDMALYGQLYLNKGKWNGVQIVPESWIEASTTSYSLYNPGYGIGYGMLWYVLVEKEDRTSKSFFHTGTGIHMLGVYPQSKVVLVHRVDTENEYDFNEGDFYTMISKVWDAEEN